MESNAPSGKVPTERELAEQFGVSVVTVRRVLRDLQAEGLIERVRGKGTYLRERSDDRPAIRPRSGTPRVNVVDSNIGMQAAAQMQILILAGLASINDDTPLSEVWDYHAATATERSMQMAGHATHTLNVSGVAMETVVGEFEDHVVHGLDGVIVIGSIIAARQQAQDVSLLRRLLDLIDPSVGSPIPAVHVIWDQPGMLPCDAVGFDGEAGVYMATRYLIESGHRHIRFLAPGWFDRDDPPYWLRERLQGFRRAFVATGRSKSMPYDIMWGKGDIAGVEYGDDVPAGDYGALGQSFWQRFSGGAMPDAVVAVNDQLARSFIEAARADSVRVPDDLSVIGYDDRFDSAAFGLSTVHVPLQEIGETAASLLLEQVRSPRVRKRMRAALTPSLVLRKTTAARSERYAIGR